MVFSSARVFADFVRSLDPSAHWVDVRLGAFGQNKVVFPFERKNLAVSPKTRLGHSIIIIIMIIMMIIIIIIIMITNSGK